ncbi:glycoside hydrolase family 16 protein [Russula earlei]|uniref:Glycoside hydrolase family 16 protein n=1 Tax=Russula earlei TaxID=71964 RepID=A0ACC0U563_9AGAM|nr:glycoside hydrolase family 16 protein [Russula earlei]
MFPPFDPYQRPEMASSSTSLLPRAGLNSSHSTLPFSLPPNPAEWGASALSINVREPDDYLHNPDPKRDRYYDHGGHIFTARGFANLGCLVLLLAALLMLFAGYPIYSHFTTKRQTTQGAFNYGGTNASGQVPLTPHNIGLIDPSTPQSAYTKPSFADPTQNWDLVFSDEFNVDGRTFWPGDDPYWEAVDLNYWQTADVEWYDPKQAFTKDGYLWLTINTTAPIDNHNMTHISGMIQSWWVMVSCILPSRPTTLSLRNKFCFTGGMIEASVRLPGSSKMAGFWPAVWTMGNLGRAGYGASVDGLWPYSYDSCDVGTLAGQVYPGTQTPLAAVENGDPAHNNVLSMLPGQRLSACTCPGESHPGPVHEDGSYVGRSAPEIDLFEALVFGNRGQVSQSAQWAPFNAQYAWQNTSDNLYIANPTVTSLNTYIGGAFQQTTSGLAFTNSDCYELESGCFAVYGYEYATGPSGYIDWIVNDTISWGLKAAGLGPDTATEIGTRPIPTEPMYIIMNLGLSSSFAHNIDFTTLTYPATMLVDYVRVYQPPNAHNIGCDPPERPTMAYINAYPDAYANPNLTLWRSPQSHQTWPKNRLLTPC